MKSAVIVFACLIAAVSAGGLFEVTIKAGTDAQKPYIIQGCIKALSPPARFLKHGSFFMKKLAAPVGTFEPAVNYTGIMKKVKSSGISASMTIELTDATPKCTDVDLSKGYSFKKGEFTYTPALKIHHVVEMKTKPGKYRIKESFPVTGASLKFTMSSSTKADSSVLSEGLLAALKKAPESGTVSSSQAAFVDVHSRVRSLLNRRGKILARNTASVGIGNYEHVGCGGAAWALQGAVTASLAKMAAVDAWAANTDKAKAKAHLKTWFGSDTAQTFTKVKGVFKLMHEKLNSDVHSGNATHKLRFVCMAAQDPVDCDEDTFALIKDNEAADKNDVLWRTVFLCPDYRDTPADGESGDQDDLAACPTCTNVNSKWGVIVHELSHFISTGDTTDDNYGVESCIKATPAVQIKTADNFEFFLECANGTLPL